MKVIVVHILAQGITHGSVSFIGVHGCGENILFSAYDFHCCLLGIVIELLGELIAAVVVEVGRIYIEQQFAVAMHRAL